MESLRGFVIQELDRQRDDIEPVERIVLAQKYHLPQWLMGAYAALCERKEPLTFSEATKLGGEIPCKIAEAREIAIRAQLVVPCPHCPTQPFQSLGDIAQCAVEDAFGREEREKEKQRQTIIEELAKEESERIQIEKEKQDHENKIKLAEAKETKEKVEMLIKDLEEALSPPVAASPPPPVTSSFGFGAVGTASGFGKSNSKKAFRK